MIFQVVCSLSIISLLTFRVTNSRTWRIKPPSQFKESNAVGQVYTLLKSTLVRIDSKKGSRTRWSRPWQWRQQTGKKIWGRCKNDQNEEEKGLMRMKAMNGYQRKGRETCVTKVLPLQILNLEHRRILYIHSLEN